MIISDALRRPEPRAHRLGPVTVFRALNMHDIAFRRNALLLQHLPHGLVAHRTL
jgi:hypothetical protein